jgi:hypothetical protein
MSTDVTFLLGRAYAGNRLLLAGSPDEDAPYTAYTVWFTYFGDDATEPWAYTDTPWWAVDAAKYVPPNQATDWALVGMSNEGHLHYTYDDKEIDEKIPGSVSSANAQRAGVT